MNPVTAFTGYRIDTTVIVDVLNSPPVQGDCNSLQSNILSSNITRAACLLWTDFLISNFIHQKHPTNLKTVKTLAQQFEIVSRFEKAKRNKSWVFWKCFIEINVIFVLFIFDVVYVLFISLSSYFIAYHQSNLAKCCQVVDFGQA